jgi:hypothetical protein
MLKDLDAKLGVTWSEVAQGAWFLDVAAAEPTATMRISRMPAKGTRAAMVA